MNNMPRILPDDEHNRRLVDHVRPINWQNPSAVERYQLVVIGAGTAGLVTAAGAAGLGARVALVERERMGGDCLNTGCVPSKALIRAARAVADARRGAQFGLQIEPPQVDFGAVMRRLRAVRAEISRDDSAERFRQLGVDVYFGPAFFTGSDQLQVVGATLCFGRAVIATGARAAVPTIPGLAEAGFYTNETIFELTELPARLAVLGGGPIGCELAQAFARLGSQVTLIDKGERVLSRDEPEAARYIDAALRRDGVVLRFGTELERVEFRDGASLLYLKSGAERDTCVADVILVAVGRRPNVEKMQLERAGVRYDEKQGVVVDDFLRTSNARIYAAGDICSRYKFTHAADALARVAIANALFAGRAKASKLIIPWCTYTDPEVAHVGLTEHEAQARYRNVRVFRQELRDVNRALIDAEEEGFVQVVTAGRSDRILGATIVASHAGDMIGEVVLAMTAGLGLKTFARTIHPYPTQQESLRKLGDAFNRTRLTPLAARLLQTWLRWFR